MKMKTVELFCASPASTAICTTTNHRAMVRRSGGSTPRPLNHRNNNNNYKFKPPAIPCTSQQHIDPKPFSTYLQKNRKSTSAASVTGKNGDFPASRKGSGELDDRNTTGGSSSRHLLDNTILVENLEDSDDGFSGGAMVVSDQTWPDDDHDDLPVVMKSLSSRRSRGDDSPALVKSGPSSRRLWGDDSHALVKSGSSSRRLRGDDSPALVKSGSSSLRLHATTESPDSKSRSSSSRNQVVELRVSIHCKGCEGKVKKHISRMEGVKSFHIDLESKKVTVIGDITPLSVLASISKVKNAQLWPSSPSSSSSSPFIAIGY